MTPVDSESSNEIKFGTDINNYEIVDPDTHGNSIIKINNCDNNSSVPGYVGITREDDDGPLLVSTIERAGQVRYGNVS